MDSSLADDDDSDNSEASVFRKAYIVLPSLEPPTSMFSKTTAPPETAPPKLPLQNPP